MPKSVPSDSEPEERRGPARGSDGLDEFRSALEKLMSATRRLRGRDASAERRGLTFPQYRMLLALADADAAVPGSGAASAAQGIRVSDLALEGGLSLATVSQMLDQLVQQGLMQRAVSTTDRRVVLNRITPKGRRALEAKRVTVERAFRGRLAEFDEHDIAIAVRVLSRLAEYYDDL